MLLLGGGILIRRQGSFSDKDIGSQFHHKHHTGQRTLKCSHDDVVMQIEWKPTTKAKSLKLSTRSSSSGRKAPFHSKVERVDSLFCLATCQLLARSHFHSCPQIAGSTMTTRTTMWNFMKCQNLGNSSKTIGLKFNGEKLSRKYRK